MKALNLSEVINAAKQSVKNHAANVREGNREFTSLSRVLKDMQRSEFLKYYAPVFGAFGAEVDAKKKLTPGDFFRMLEPEQLGQTYSKKGEKVGDVWFGIWGTRQKKNEAGEKMYEADGVTPIMEDVLRKVTSWTPNKVFTMLAQAAALKAAK